MNQAAPEGHSTPQELARTERLEWVDNAPRYRTQELLVCGKIWGKTVDDALHQNIVDAPFQRRQIGA
jgi:hypothetical protein